jgi:hypothetical protein
MRTKTLKMMVRLLIATTRQMVQVAKTGGTSEITLASSASGRILLHLLCAKRDHHFLWHWHGVIREFRPALIPIKTN